MIDFKSVRVSGVLNFARARVLWQDGVLKFYDKTGQLAVVENATEPVKMTNWFRSWSVLTPQGAIKLREKCKTCGGWDKVTRTPAALIW